jgi:hypothetical protein
MGGPPFDFERWDSTVVSGLVFLNLKSDKSCRAALGLDGSETRPYMVQLRFYLLFQLPTFVPVDVTEPFVLMCNYTGKEVV